MSKTHEEYLEDFLFRYKDIIEIYPDKKHTFINMFNDGFSNGAIWEKDHSFIPD